MKISKYIFFLRTVILFFTIILFHQCVDESNVVTISGKVVNPRYPYGDLNHIYKGSRVEKLEARSGNTTETISKDAFVSTVNVDEAGSFDITINRDEIGSLFLYLKDGVDANSKILSYPFDKISATTNLGDVFFVKRDQINFTACWQGGGDHDIHLVNAVSKDSWYPNSTLGQAVEAEVDYSSVTNSGCESITILKDTGVRYYIGMKSVVVNIDFNVSSKPSMVITTKSKQVKVTYGANTNEIFYADPIIGTPVNDHAQAAKNCKLGLPGSFTAPLGTWWVVAFYEAGKITLIDGCATNSVSTSIPLEFTTEVELTYPLP